MSNTGRPKGSYKTTADWIKIFTNEMDKNIFIKFCENDNELFMFGFYVKLLIELADQENYRIENDQFVLKKFSRKFQINSEKFDNLLKRATKCGLLEEINDQSVSYLISPVLSEKLNDLLHNRKARRERYKQKKKKNQKTERSDKSRVEQNRTEQSKRKTPYVDDKTNFVYDKTNISKGENDLNNDKEKIDEDFIIYLKSEGFNKNQCEIVNNIFEKFLEPQEKIKVAEQIKNDITSTARNPTGVFYTNLQNEDLILKKIISLNKIEQREEQKRKDRIKEQEAYETPIAESLKEKIENRKAFLKLFNISVSKNKHKLGYMFFSYPLSKQRAILQHINPDGLNNIGEIKEECEKITKEH